ncbi:MAG TPA: DUF2809 domain-containing protein [Candidatus Cloacimonetes bacterium]|nr:DUF2809 domain-containing protein [Candidatus Cloacimonadota bacterium]
MTIKTLISILVIVPLGFLSNIYQGPFSDWLNDSFGGLLYEIFWCLIIFLFFPKTKPFKIALIVFISTCCLEFLQLWHPSFLEVIRKDYIGRIILGNSFNITDFPYYLFGSLSGWFWILKLKE